MLTLPWMAKATPATAPVSAPAPIPSPLPLPTVSPSPPATVSAKRSRKSAKRPTGKLYAVIDRRGVVVGTSTFPVPQETAETHAAAFLEWLLKKHEGFAGRPVLHDVAGRLYAETFCPALGLQPFPWRSVGTALGELPGVTRDKRHVDTDDWRKRVKRLAYILPGAQAAVVELDARRAA